VRGHAETRHFLHLQVDVSVDVGISEHATLGQEGTVLVQIFQSLIQAVAHGGDQCVFFRGQVVQVLRGGFARMDLVFHAVQTTYGMRIEAERFLAE